MNSHNKTALCLHGYFSNAGGASASQKGFDYINSKILASNDVDVFIHSWDIAYKKTMLSLYDPKKHVVERQNQFKEELLSFDEEWFRGDGEPSSIYSPNTIYKTLSFLYSRKAAVQLKKEHEEEHGFTYDCVILCRFDLGQRGKDFPQKYYATNFNFSDQINMQLLHSAYWDQLNHGFADHWFYSNSKNMDKVSKLYDKVVDYYQPNSDYVKAVTEGWPESNEEDIFSNEMLKDEKSNSLVTFPKYACIDNHKLYKWYFMDTGLYEKCSFIDITKDW